MTYVQILRAFESINGCYMNIGQDKHEWQGHSRCCVQWYSSSFVPLPTDL